LNYLRVIFIPEPSIVSTVISIASFSINKFIFEGFLPKKKIYKEILFNKFIYENRTCIFFETGERIIETLFLIKSIINSERTVFIAKDLTKKFEFIFNFKLSDLNYDYISSVNFFTKGEFVILLSPFDEKEIFLNYFNNISLFTYLKNDFFLKKIVFSSYLKISTYVFFD
jgi:16S rRNA (cytidine1402-2'-O)-methyltransferase